jgi:hypothetical protein
MRDALLAKIQAQYDADPAPPPVVTLDDYFTGTDGRPPLAELYARFKSIQHKPTVQPVLVGIHGDWTEARKHPGV